MAFSKMKSISFVPLKIPPCQVRTTAIKNDSRDQVGSGFSYPFFETRFFRVLEAMIKAENIRISTRISGLSVVHITVTVREAFTVS
jgi:hypothetical protein